MLALCLFCGESQRISSKVIFFIVLCSDVTKIRLV